MQLFIALVFFFLASVKGVDLLFFGGDSVCDTSNEDYLGCSNLVGGRCCQSPQKLFCSSSILQHVAGNTDHYVMAEGLCDRNGNYSSIQDNYGLTNCIGIPVDDSSDQCSSFWESSLGRERAGGGGSPDRACQEPDKLVYHDGNGTRRIYMPEGTFWDAMRDYQAKDFEALAAFPAWGGSETKADV